MTTTEIKIPKTKGSGELPRHENGFETRGRDQKIKNKIKNDVTVFLVDDDNFFLNGLYYYLTDSLSPKIKLKKFSTAEDCLMAMDQEPDIIVLDYMLSTGSPNAMNGISALKKITELSPETFVIMLSAQDDIDVALDAMTEGAYDYISKSETAFLRLKNTIRNVAETISENADQDRAERITKRINLIVIVLLLLLFVVSRIVR